MLGPKVRGLDDVARFMDQINLVDTLLAWSRETIGYVFTMDLQVLAFRGCKHNISSHIGTNITGGGFVTRLTRPHSRHHKVFCLEVLSNYTVCIA